MFKPKYNISNQLLNNVKQITQLIAKLNYQKFSKPVLMDLANNAREVSVFASTSIEGNPLSLTQVKKILKSHTKSIKNSEQEVLNYNLALICLNKVIKSKKTKLSSDLILNIHKIVANHLLPNFESGHFRKKPVVVNDPRTNNVVFLPPDHAQVELLMQELIVFITQKTGAIDPLILAGIFHKQMLIIHPFVDGNGRTARLITKFLLAKMGVNTFNLFSFENYYNKNVTRYFQTVGECGDYNDLANKINFTKWLEYFTEGIIDELFKVSELLPKSIDSPKNKLEKHHLKIINFIKNNGYITDKDYAKITPRAKATRALDFKKLIELEIIERRAKGRATYYVIRKDE